MFCQTTTRLRIREPPSPLLRTRDSRIAGFLPAREPNAFRQVLLFKFASGRSVPGVSHAGEPSDHSQGEQNGGVGAERRRGAVISPNHSVILSSQEGSPC